MEKKSQLMWIDFMKGIAICGIVMIHSGAASLPTYVGKLGRCGERGVQIFFVISAFLMFMSLDNYYYNDNLNVMKWYKEKFCRLMPLWYMAIALYTAMGGNLYYLGSAGKVSFVNVLVHILFLNGFFPLYCNSIIGGEWYIGALAIMYIIGPILYKRANSLKKSLLFMILCIAASECYRMVAPGLVVQGKDAQLYDIFFLKFMFINSLPVIAEGIVLYYFIKSSIYDKLRGKGFCFLISGLLIVIVKTLETCEILNLPSVADNAIWGMGFCLIMVGISMNDHIFSREKLFTKLGRYSFGIYLFHMAVVNLWDRMVQVSSKHIFIYWGIKFIIIMAISTLFSLFVHKFYEQPILNMQYFSKGKKNQK